MKCPHCLVQINANVKEISLGYDSEFYWRAFVSLCPNPDYKKLIIDLGKGNVSQDENGKYLLHNIVSKQTVYPQTSGRLAAPPEVEEQYADIYKEACLVLPFSQQAAAALGRKCLQLILRDKADIKPSNLSKEIDDVVGLTAVDKDNLSIRYLPDNSAFRGNQLTADKNALLASSYQKTLDLLSHTFLASFKLNQFAAIVSYKAFSCFASF